MKTFRFLTIILLLANCSCEGFLDVRPQGEVVNNELFKNAEGFEDALYGVYATLAGEDFYGRKMTYWMNDILAQYYTRNVISDETTMLAAFRYEDQTVRPMIDDLWVGMYKNIGYVNNILINLKRFEPSDLTYYNLYRAESLGLRAFMHFELLRFFSENIVNNPSARGIPYNENYSYQVPPFLSAFQVYDKIIADFKEAETLLAAAGEDFGPDDANRRGFLRDRNIHINLHAVRALLARVYWTKGELQQAAEYCAKVIDSGVFSLADKSEIADLMNGIISPQETIWGLFSDRFYRSTEADLFIADKGLHLKSHEDDYAADRVGADYRYEGWFRYYSASLHTQGWRCIKVFDIFRQESRRRPTAVVAGVSIIRLPELYYIMAEYHLSMNNQSEAMEYFDRVLSSRGLTPMADRGGNTTLTIGHIIRERKKEFICEGQYFHTLKRYNQDIYDPRNMLTFPASNDIYVFPIPENEINYRD
ncbi:MAG: RagB/SusD family nutrient uptake outer membrane protein [Rikenellaceae bacterium]|nr:RagB/SusD family nutrient uptake outer membrane protein [Rikenellaceae bacterium]MCL2692491.1 RagB/SusD family nutrient uptake outer membrane protein [Rikenellaceae bacterium]